MWGGHRQAPAVVVCGESKSGLPTLLKESEVPILPHFGLIEQRRYLKVPLAPMIAPEAIPTNSPARFDHRAG